VPEKGDASISEFRLCFADGVTNQFAAFNPRMDDLVRHRVEWICPKVDRQK